MLPLSHRPGHVQADFGEALAVMDGVGRKIVFCAASLPHGDICFVKAPAKLKAADVSGPGPDPEMRGAIVDFS